MILKMSLMIRLVCWYTPSDDMCNKLHSVVSGEENLVDVVEKVMDLASRWNSFGLALRLKPAELETISSKNNTDPTECLKDMLLTWLRQQYIKKVGPPSWRMLCKAISVQVGGNNPALAKEIALTVVKQAAPMGDCITA